MTGTGFPSEDTIAAVAGGVGGAVSVVRVSGGDALQIAAAVWESRDPLDTQPVRELAVGQVVAHDGTPVDQCLAVVFRAPRSYTGEDVVEFHTHGGMLAPREVLHCLLRAGARLAEPGEFTKRAFINGKLDLTQAEAVGDLISAHTEMALHLANRQLTGALSRAIHPIYSALTQVLAEVESRLDFPEESLDWMPSDTLQRWVGDAREAIRQLERNRHTGEVLREGVRLVIAGPPNVGKSSLLNHILGRERAIVTEIPGTTRDTLEELAHVRGIPVRLTDTAGIREAEDLVEKTGIDRSRASMQEAQVVLWVYDARHPVSEQSHPEGIQAPVIHVGNKMDLLGDGGGALPAGHVSVSALTGAGMEALFDAIERTVWERPRTSEPECAVSVRHAVLLEQAMQALDGVADLLAQEAWELVAIQARESLEAIGRITGQTASVDILDTIFANFCIGK